jgi:hypothetical protein
MQFTAVFSKWAQVKFFVEQSVVAALQHVRTVSSWLHNSVYAKSTAYRARLCNCNVIDDIAVFLLLRMRVHSRRNTHALTHKHACMSLLLLLLLQVWSYDGRPISSPRLPNLRAEFLNRYTIALGQGKQHVHYMKQHDRLFYYAVALM